MSILRITGGVLAAGIVVLTSWASKVPTTFSGSGDARIRLSWRADGVTVKACRTLSEEELAARPIHMRNPLACIGELAPFLLEVELDGLSVTHDTVSPGGARGDRPVFVYHAFPVSPGTHEVSVRFTALVPPDAEAPQGIGAYEWVGPITLAAAEIALITLDDTGQMVLRRPD